MMVDTGVIIRSTFKLSISVFVLAGNTMILLAIKKAKSLHEVTYYLLANLAVSDILLGLSVGSHAVVRLVEANGFACAAVSLGNLSGGISMSGVLLLCVQSFLCMRFPVRFRTGFSKRTAAILIIATWVLWTCHTVYGGVQLYRLDRYDGKCGVMSGKNDHLWMGIIAFVGDGHMIALSVLQVALLVMIHRRKRSLRSQRQPSCIAESARHLKRLNNFSKMVTIIGMVLVLFLVSWGPFLVALSVFTVCEEPWCKQLEEIGALPSMTILNSLGNVFIYWKKSDEFRAAFSNMCRCRQRIGVMPTVPENGTEMNALTVPNSTRIAVIATDAV